MNRAVSWFCKIFLAPIIKILFIKEIRGLENIPKRNFIMATNHQSHLDELAAGYLCVPKRHHFIGQTESYTGFNKFLLNLVYIFGGVIRLDRTSEKSKKRVLKEAIRTLKKGDSLIMYPEGTRTRTGEIGKGKWGIAKIFLETGVPILPLAISGTFELLPPGGKLKIKKIVKMNIGNPLYFKEEFKKAKNLNYNSEEKQQILIEITGKIMESITLLKSEIE